MSSKHQFNRKLVEKLLKSRRIKSFVLQKSNQVSERAALGSRGVINHARRGRSCACPGLGKGRQRFMGVATAYAMMLFSSVDEVKIGSKCAYHIDAALQVAALHNAGNCLIESSNLILKLFCFYLRGIGKAFSALAQTPTFMA